MANSSDYRLGSIWLVTFDPSKGTEIRKTRPALIVSGTLFNQQRSKVTVLLSLKNVTTADFWQDIQEIRTLKNQEF